MSPENFTFSPGRVNLIRSLNHKLKAEEERIRPFANKLIEALKKQAREKQIDDFNIRQHLSFFSNNTACNKRHNVEAGDPFSEEKGFLLFGEQTEDMFYSDNWNELQKGHPLADELFCYSMHCLVFHGSLSWQDILDTDDVWFELKVDYQFFVGMGGK